MSRHRKHRHPYGQPASTTPDPTPAPQPAPATPPRATERTAELLALRAQLDETRREINARLDILATAIDGLLAGQAPGARTAAAVPTPTASAASTPAPSVLPPLRVGAEVYVPRLGGTYRILEVAPNGRAFTVQTGMMRVLVRRDEVWTLDGAAVPPPHAKATNGAPHTYPEISATIEEIDLHGFTEDEALITLELFLQQAYARRITRVRIIHGKGNGILRAAVRRELARNPLVRSMETGPHFHGDDGVTLADLDL